ncbi:hypothetical protein ACFE04_005247 [Oxalis oulophora]
MAASLLQILFFLCCLLTVTAHHLKFKLVHYQSKLSPLFNNKSNISETRELMLKRSYKRIATYDLQPTVVTVDPLFLVNFFIGNPPVKQSAIMDTGSDYLWVQGKNCSVSFEGLIRDAKSADKLYDKLNSSTYKSLSCYNEHCKMCRACGCDGKGECKFGIKFGSGLTIKGDIGTETLQVEGQDGTLQTVPNIVFGDAQDKTITSEYEGTVVGIFGLASGGLSLIDQLGSNKFSHCVGLLKEPEYDYNTLIIGDRAVLEGKSIPFTARNTHYYVSLEFINVGEQCVGVDRDEFKMDQNGEGGVILDTGTELSYLTSEACGKLADLVNDIMLDMNFERIPYADVLCYKTTIDQLMNKTQTTFPYITFHLTNNTDLVLSPDKTKLSKNIKRYHGRRSV